MLLKDDERQFLAAFINEPTTDPFMGSATQELHQRNIYYDDLSHLMAAYYRENTQGQEGFGGRYDPVPPSCPWEDRDAAVRRDRELESALETAANPGVS